MMTSAQYHLKARENEYIAEHMADPQAKSFYAHIANDWRNLESMAMIQDRAMFLLNSRLEAFQRKAVAAAA